MTNPLTSIVLIEAAGEIWSIAPGHRAHRMPDPVLSTMEIALLAGQLRRAAGFGSSAREIPRDVVKAIASVKRIFRDGDDRATIDDFQESVLDDNRPSNPSRRGRPVGRTPRPRRSGRRRRS